MNFGVLQTLIAGLFALLVAWFGMRRARDEFEWRFPLSTVLRKGGAFTPGTAAAQYHLEYKALLDQWGETNTEGSHDGAVRSELFRKKAEEMRLRADSLWASPNIAHRYYSAYLYAIAAAAALLAGQFSLAGDLYHYSGMLFRVLNEWERAGGFYCSSGLCQERMNTETELIKARRSFTRAIAAYESGGNPEGVNAAREFFDRVNATLRSEFNFVWASEEVIAYEKLCEKRKLVRNGRQLG